MDVQAAAPAVPVLPPALSQIAVGQPPPGNQPLPNGIPPAPTSISAALPNVAPASKNDSDSSGQGNSNNSNGTQSNAIGPTPGLATLPAAATDGSKKGHHDTTLASNVAALYNVQQQNITVSFQIEQNPNEIVTVFTDKQTGKVIIQFPSETMIALAKLFDKLDGSVVNKKV
jgi:uncharacterized FlaG/YvyC family protein